MTNFTRAFLAMGAAAVLMCCVVLPLHARDAQIRLAADKLDPQTFEQKLQDTRANIKKDQKMTTRPADNAATNQIVTDICKKNPKLPQCKL